MGERVLLCLSADDLAELQRIVMDEDAAGALVFLTEVVLPRVEARRKQGMRSDLDGDNGRLSR